MTLEESIKHCEDVADYDCFTDDQRKCSDEHRQLADWLRELKERREKEVTGDLISRQQALSTIEANQGTLNKRRVMKILEGLPSAQHENKRQATVSSDCISRKDAIRDIRSMDVCVMYDDMCSTEEAVEKAIVATKRTAIFGLECMPSAEHEIIHCKDCKHRDSNDCPMYYEEWIEIDEGDGYFDTDNIIHDRTTDEGFCHCAELRGKEE